MQAKLNMDTEYQDLRVLGGDRQRVAGRVTVTMSIELFIPPDVDIDLLGSVVRGTLVNADEMSDADALRLIADTLDARACEEGREPVVGVPRRRTGRRDLDVG